MESLYRNTVAERMINSTDLKIKLNQGISTVTHIHTPPAVKKGLLYPLTKQVFLLHFMFQV